MQASFLRCEYHVDPLGIDIPRPRLSWELASDRRGARQTAYQIRATIDGAKVWDSGRVESDATAHIAYDGPPLESRQRVAWSVTVWDENDDPHESGTAWFETGLLDGGDWSGDWIGSDDVGGPYTGAPSPYLRQTFTVEQPVARARLYITALGLYEASINGQRVGDAVFTPGWTDYNARVQYQVYDVAEMLAQGENAIGAILGDGWYCGHIAADPRQTYGDRPQLLAQLEITYADGTGQTVATGPDWRTSPGPILENDMIMGESYDARREMPGWDAPGFDDSGWRAVTVFDDPGIALVATRGTVVRPHEEIKPIAPPTTYGSGWNRTAYVYDLGQNMVGRVRLKVSGPAGTTVRLRYAEMLQDDGRIYTENLRSARATDHYTLRGGVEEVYESHFTFHGFRYVEVSGVRLGDDAITGVVLQSDTPPTGTFTCSDPLVTQLQHNIIWGQKGNFLEVPTDCPQRDERLGWTGDAQVFIRTATFNMDVAAFFSKWQVDLADAQTPAGQIPSVVPRLGLAGTDGGPAWADALVICPWTLYTVYGDRQILEDHYDSLKQFMTYLGTTTSGLIRCHPDVSYPPGGRDGYGDWLSTHAETPKDLIGTAFYAHDAQTMAQIAHILGHEEDARVYTQLADSVRNAFLHRFVTADGLITGMTQTAYVLALQFDLLPDDLRERATQELVRDIEKRGWHLSTGFVGTPYLLHVLTAAGRLDVAYRLLHQTDYPSWLYPVTQGATTIWERWDSWTHDKGFQTPSMNSFNHYAYGAVGDWLYRVVAGIDTAEPGYKHLNLHPRPGGDLRSAAASQRTINGTVRSDWRITPGGFDWHITVPPNTTARVHVPASQTATLTESGVPADQAAGVTPVGYDSGTMVYEVASGSYHFVVE